jgi:hypothetical protein
MKIFSGIMLTLGVGAALMSASVSPSSPSAEKKEYSDLIKTQPVAAPEAQVQAPTHSSAILVLAPQKNLETAIRTSEQGDILLMGPDGWYRLEGKALQQGTKVYVLGSQSSMVGAFPKEAGSPSR